MLQCVAVCCSVLQCAAVCCSVLQCAAVCYSTLQCTAVCCNVLQDAAVYYMSHVPMTIHASLLMRKPGEHLDLPETSRAKPVKLIERNSPPGGVAFLSGFQRTTWRERTTPIFGTKLVLFSGGVVLRNHTKRKPSRGGGILSMKVAQYPQ